jgi:hypothetical protein
MLALKDDVSGAPMYTAEDIRDLYRGDAYNLLLVDDVSNGASFYIVICFTIMIAAIFYGIGICLYNHN